MNCIYRYSRLKRNICSECTLQGLKYSTYHLNMYKELLEFLDDLNDGCNRHNRNTIKYKYIKFTEVITEVI